MTFTYVIVGSWDSGLKENSQEKCERKWVCPTRNLKNFDCAKTRRNFYFKPCFD